MTSFAFQSVLFRGLWQCGVQCIKVMIILGLAGPVFMPIYAALVSILLVLLLLFSV